jgi:hypothetical protein
MGTKRGLTQKDEGANMSGLPCLWTCNGVFPRNKGTVQWSEASVAHAAIWTYQIQYMPLSSMFNNQQITKKLECWHKVWMNFTPFLMSFCYWLSCANWSKILRKYYWKKADLYESSCEWLHKFPGECFWEFSVSIGKLKLLKFIWEHIIQMSQCLWLRWRITSN